MKTQETATTTSAKTPRSGSKKSPTRRIKGATATKAAAKATKATKPQGAKDGARSGSKTATVLELLRRKQGATLAEIAKATDWQNHSIRGFVSGHITKKLGLKVESTKSEAGGRTYRIVG
jgi:hypothetical protein